MSFRQINSICEQRQAEEHDNHADQCYRQNHLFTSAYPESVIELVERTRICCGTDIRGNRHSLTDIAVALVVLQQRPSFQEIRLQRPKVVIYVLSSTTRNLGTSLIPIAQGDLGLREQSFVFRA
jgi:hypothetical protein